MGAHRELLKTQGTYANLYIKQFGQIKPEEEQLEGSLYDLLHSPAFQHRWPTVRTAFNAEAMRAHLQNALFAPEGLGYIITHCKPGKASYLGDDGCVLRYEIQMKQANSDETQTSLVLARIFPGQAEAETYARKRLAPLAAKMKGRPEIAAFAHPVAVLEELNMAVSIFPIDGELPALIAATDQQEMTEFFRQTLPADGDNRFVVEECAIEAGHYGRQHRCVLRYEVDGSWADANGDMEQPGRQVVYGKVAADDRCKLVGAVVTSLHWHMRNFKSARQFRIPRIVGYRPNLRLILLESIPGTPQVPQLLQARLKGTDDSRPGALTLEAALQDCARIAAGLHKTEIKTNNSRTFEDEMAALQAHMPSVQEFSPALGMQLQAGFRRLQAHAAQTQPQPLGLGHGDYTYTQLLFDESSCGLVDFDTACQAEPALDLGQFVAYLRLEARRAQRRADGAELAVDDLCNLFVDTYIQAAGYGGLSAEQLRARVAAYEIISLSRIALHSWQKMKSSRLELVAELLEERITCLPKINPSIQRKNVVQVRSANTPAHPQPGFVQA